MHFQRLGQQVEVVDHMNKPMDALTLFSKAVEHLNKMCLEALKEKQQVDKGCMRWVLTIPSMWENFSKEFIRKAAEQVSFFALNKNFLTLRFFTYLVM